MCCLCSHTVSDSWQIFADLGLNDNKETAAEGEVQSEITLQCYQQDFEKYFIEESHQYYARKAAQWTEDDSFPDYMSKVQV